MYLPASMLVHIGNLIKNTGCIVYDALIKRVEQGLRSEDVKHEWRDAMFNRILTPSILHNFFHKKNVE